MLISIDTSVVVGLLDSQDHWHSTATSVQAALLGGGFSPVYFDCVVTEAVSTLARRLREKRREAELPDLWQRLSTALPEETLTWVLPDVPRLYGQVMDLIRTSEGELNFNDSLIALACRERHIEALASFDRDFDRLSWLQRVSTPEDIRAFLAVTKKVPEGQD
ncbi:MAG: type II toxin-antitoxin system VapC family toxin [Candidatus Binatia bacterium]